MQTRHTIIGLLLCLIVSAIPAMAQIPRTMNYQGSLKATDGTPVSGEVQMTFSLHDALVGGTQLWDEAQTVTVTDGIYSVILGSSAPLDLAFDTPYFLQIDIWNNDTSQYERLNPRQKLTSVPYALKAAGMEGMTISNGNVGIGTSTPEAKLDVAGNINMGTYLTFDGNSPSNKLIMGGSDLRGMALYPNTSALNSQSWVQMWGNDGSARAGELDIAGSYINFRYGVTNADYGYIGMTLASNGNVGIGNAAPSHKLDVAGRFRLIGEDHPVYGVGTQRFAENVLSLESSGGTSLTYPYIEWRRNGGRGAYLGWGVHGSYLEFKLESGNNLAILGGKVGIGTTTPQYALDVNGTIRGTSIIPSDVRLKEDIVELDSALSKIITLRGTRFRLKRPEPPNTPKQPDAPNVFGIPAIDRYAALASSQNRPTPVKPHDDRLHLGVIAQEVEQVFPEAVFTDDTGYKSVAYDMLIAPLIEAVKELKAENDALKAQNAEFERRLSALEAAMK